MLKIQDATNTFSLSAHTEAGRFIFNLIDAAIGAITQHDHILYKVLQKTNGTSGAFSTK